MPSPKTADFAPAAGREILDILRRTKGRAFVLFTSYAVLRTVQGVLEGALEYPLLVQGSAPRSTLLASSGRRRMPSCSATSSFWQGVDVVGDALSCVIIDRLPFASPGDPVVAARVEAIASRGGDGFADLQVPLAILTLLQGLGRLHPPPPGPRGAGHPRSAHQDHALRAPVPRVAAAGAGWRRPGRDRPVFRQRRPWRGSQRRGFGCKLATIGRVSVEVFSSLSAPSPLKRSANVSP